MECNLWHYIALIVILIIEYWLGRTQRLKSSSIIEFTIAVIVAVIVRIIYYKEPDHDDTI